MDQNRRKFLKIIFIGSGVLLVGRILGPLYARFFSDSSAKTNSSNEISTGYEKFRIVRNNDGLSIYDTTGEEIFQIDNGV